MRHDFLRARPGLGCPRVDVFSVTVQAETSYDKADQIVTVLRSDTEALR
ncbi:hypothetical protein [Arthrobacter sp. TMN-49]